MKTASQNTALKLTTSNARKIKKACRLTNFTPEKLVNDLLSHITITVIVKPKEYEL